VTFFERFSQRRNTMAANRPHANSSRARPCRKLLTKVRPFWPQLREPEFKTHRVGAISRCPSIQGRLSCSTSRASWARSVEQRVRLRAPVNRSPVGRCATPGAPRPPAARPGHRGVTFVNGRDGDICIWWTHLGVSPSGPRARRRAPRAALRLGHPVTPAHARCSFESGGRGMCCPAALSTGLWSPADQTTANADGYRPLRTAPEAALPAA
jgi:hypothetical protein